MRFFLPIQGALIILILMACQGEHQTERAENFIFLSDSLINSRTISLLGHPVNFDTGPVLGYLTDFCHLTDRIYFFEQIVHDDCFGALVDIEDRRVLTKIGMMGRGPMELTTLFDFHKSEDSLYFFDFITNKVVVTSLDGLQDSTARISSDNSREYYFSSPFSIEMLLLLEDKWIVRNYNFKRPDSAFVELEPNTMKPRRYFGNLPDDVTDRNKDPRLRLIGNLTYGAIRPDNEKMVQAYRFRDLIEIYNTEGEMEKSIAGPENHFPELSESSIRRFDPIPIYGKTWYGYSKVVAREEGFYAGYVGKREPTKDMYPDDGLIDDKYSTSSFQYIDHFNWDGELLARYELEHQIIKFEVDEEKRIIYGRGRGHLDEDIFEFTF